MKSLQNDGNAGGGKETMGCYWTVEFKETLDADN